MALHWSYGLCIRLQELGPVETETASVLSPPVTGKGWWTNLEPVHDELEGQRT